MVITTRFELSAPIEAAWAYLLDVPKIAHCVPGASLTDVIDDKTYAGKVEVKLGPIGVAYTHGRARAHGERQGRGLGDSRQRWCLRDDDGAAAVQ